MRQSLFLALLTLLMLQGYSSQYTITIKCQKCNSCSQGTQCMIANGGPFDNQNQGCETDANCLLYPVKMKISDCPTCSDTCCSTIIVADQQIPGPCIPDEEKSKFCKFGLSGLEIGLIIGGSVLGALIIGGVIFFIIRKRKNQNKEYASLK